MKILTLILISIIASFAKADQLDDHLEKMKSVIEKDDRCEFSVVTIPKDRTRKDVWPRGAVCVGTIGFNQGTMKERSGCGAFYLNTNNLIMSSLIPQLDYNMAENKKCRLGGFEAVMDDLLFTDNTVTPSKRVPVKWAFTSAYRLPDSEFDVQLIYVNQTVEKFRDWFTKEKANYLADQEKAKKKSK